MLSQYLGFLRSIHSYAERAATSAYLSHQSCGARQVRAESDCRRGDLPLLKFATMTPLHDSLNSCFSELTGRGDFDAACFPRQHCNPAGQWCTNGDGCVLASAPQQAPVKVQLQGQAVSRLTNALLEANDRIFKFNTTSVSPAETPAASEQLCGPARPLQVRT